MRSVRERSAVGPLALIVGLGLAVGVAASDERGGRDGRALGLSAKHDLQTWGRISKAVKGHEPFFEITYYVKDKRGRLKSQKGFLKISDTVALSRDRRVRVTDLETNEAVRIFGEPVEYEVRGRGGGLGAGGVQGGRDRQIKNAKVVLAGDVRLLEVNKTYKDRRDEKLVWVEATVEKAAGGLSVLRESQAHRVVMAKGAPVLRRQRLEWKDLKKATGLYVFIRARKTEERPDTGRRTDEKKESFEAQQLIILDPRYVKTVYQMLLTY